MGLDHNFFLDVNHFASHTSWAHGFMKVVAVDFVGLFGLVVLAGWWQARSGRDPIRGVAAAIWAAVGTLVAVLVNQPIGHAVNRARPYATLHGVEVLVSRTQDSSFPSDHAVTAGAATAGIWIVAYYAPRVLRWLAAASTVLALFIAFARVYVGAHYPGDVAAGLGIGAGVVLVGWLILRPVLIAGVGRLAGVRKLRPFVFAGP